MSLLFPPYTLLFFLIKFSFYSKHKSFSILSTEDPETFWFLLLILNTFLDMKLQCLQFIIELLAQTNIHKQDYILHFQILNT